MRKVKTWLISALVIFIIIRIVMLWIKSGMHLPN